MQSLSQAVSSPKDDQILMNHGLARVIIAIAYFTSIYNSEYIRPSESADAIVKKLL